MKRCVILDDYQDVALRSADWGRLAGAVAVHAVCARLEGEDALAEALRDAEIVVAMRERSPITAALLARLPRLELLVTSGMRNAAIDIAAARARGVVVCGTASSSAPPVELTWALILDLARHVAAENAALRAGGPWQHSVGTDLYGHRLGVIGLGKIGGRVARIGAAFGMEVTAWSPHLTDARAAAAGAARAPSLEALLEACGIVTLHLVLSETTRGILDAAALRRMRRDALLVNTARAGLVDQAALVRALQDGWIAGAALDVFDQEPLPADHPFRRLPNVLATPHLGYVTRDNYRVYFTEAVDDIAAWLAGRPIRELD